MFFKIQEFLSEKSEGYNHTILKEVTTASWIRTVLPRVEPRLTLDLLLEQHDFHDQSPLATVLRDVSLCRVLVSVWASTSSDLTLSPSPRSFVNLSSRERPERVDTPPEAVGVPLARGRRSITTLSCFVPGTEPRDGTCPPRLMKRV
ncbi:unnamed protein product [Pleuronectes platessa]|uniref:Uncharacterized protein n=1 Tax=Pleuronectes platessa TaxID=8262 RepID=A0A9N7W3U3_PLEPL|nr:unnamed protein product [Pleuronectes platessa]